MFSNFLSSSIINEFLKGIDTVEPPKELLDDIIKEANSQLATRLPELLKKEKLHFLNNFKANYSKTKQLEIITAFNEAIEKAEAETPKQPILLKKVINLDHQLLEDWILSSSKTNSKEQAKIAINEMFSNKNTLAILFETKSQPPKQHPYIYALVDNLIISDFSTLKEQNIIEDAYNNLKEKIDLSLKTILKNL